MSARRAARLEIAVDDAADAVRAFEAGADRIELCAALEVGGVTPGPGLLAEVRASARGEWCVLARPRRGDFIYDAATFRALVRDVEAAREAGADGVAFGVLLADGALDVPRMRELVAAAASLTVCMHRAFDLLPDARRGLDALAALGVRRVLSSGGAARAIDGREALARSVRHAAESLAGAIEVVAAGGVRSEHLAELARATGVGAVHASASRLVRGPAGGVSLAPSKLPAEGERRVVDAREVAELRAAWEALG